MPRSWPLPVPLTAIAVVGSIVTLVPLFFGLPDVHDGFWHLQWNQAWTAAFLAGQWIPRWYDQAWGGLGNPIFSFYPPLFRLLSLPSALLGASPTLQLKTAIGLIVLLHAGLATWVIQQLKPPFPQWQQGALLLGALFNPYFLVNLYVRGAWPEALGICFLWGLIQAVSLYSESRHQKATVWLSISLTGLLLSHNPTSLIAFYSLAILLLLTTLRQQWQALRGQLLGIGSSLGLAAFTLLPALLDYQRVTPVSPVDSAAFLFFRGGTAINFADVLNFIWFSLVLLILACLSRLQRRTEPLNLLILWSGLALLVSLAMCTAPVGAWLLNLPLVSKLQFPWRWLSIAWPCLMIWVGLNWGKAANISRVQQGFSLVLTTAAIIVWLSGLAKFPKDYINIGSSDLARLDAVLQCSPVTVCPEGVEAISQVSRWPLKGAESTSTGEVMITMPKEYLPPSLPDSFWVIPRYQDFWFPRQQPGQWASLKGSGTIQLLDFGPGHRTVRVQTLEPNTITLRQFPSPFWQLTVSRWSSPTSVRRLIPNSATGAWIQFSLPAGDWQVSLDYQPSFGDRLGRAISLITAAGLIGSGIILRAQKQRRPSA